MTEFESHEHEVIAAEEICRTLSDGGKDFVRQMVSVIDSFPQAKCAMREIIDIRDRIDKIKLGRATTKGS